MGLCQDFIMYINQNVLKDTLVSSKFAREQSAFPREFNTLWMDHVDHDISGHFF